MKKIGLVGGISWVSTMDYYKWINEGVNEALGGLHFAECLVYSLDFGAVQAKGWENSFDLLLHACKALKKAGADVLVLCANTAHLFADRLRESVQLPLIHIGAETATVVKEQGIKRVGLLGTKFTMELEFYRKKLEENGLDVLIPETPELRDYIQYTLKEELGRGLIRQETKEQYLLIASKLLERGAEGIILACTEIPILISQQDFTAPVFDTTRIHAKAAVRYALFGEE